MNAYKDITDPCSGRCTVYIYVSFDNYAILFIRSTIDRRLQNTSFFGLCNYPNKCYKYRNKNSLILGTMISIPKDKKKYIGRSLNYRAIALGSMFNKIIYWIILLKEHNCLSSSPLQISFIKGLYITQL